jgi:hypothetical protein
MFSMIGIAREFVEGRTGESCLRSQLTKFRHLRLWLGIVVSGGATVGATADAYKLVPVTRGLQPFGPSRASALPPWFKKASSEVTHVLHKCANPACLTPFRKLSQGKLFLVEKEPFEGSKLRRANWRGQSLSRIEYYWLCDQCAFALTLSYEKGKGVVTVARPEVARKRPALAAHAQEVSHDASIRTEQSA